jgi:hypothetical protein
MPKHNVLGGDFAHTFLAKIWYKLGTDNVNTGGLESFDFRPLFLFALREV